MLNLWARVKQLWSAKEEPHRKEVALEQMHDFVISVGQAHLACVLVEQQLHELLRSFGYPDNDVPAWLAPGQRHRLAKAIAALNEQFGLPSSFTGHLERFRTQRNEFTHNIWRDGDMRVGSELTKMHQKVRDLYRTAR